MRDYKNNLGFFNKWGGGEALGIGIMAVGFAMLWLGRGPFYRIAGAVLLFGGLAVFFILGAGLSSEKNIREEIRQKCEGIFIELQGDSHFFRRVPDHPKEYVLEGFLYDEGVCLKAAKNQDIISSLYCYVKMQVLNDAFYIRMRTFSLVSDDCKEEIYDVHFDAIEEIRIEKQEADRKYRDKTFHVRECFVVIVYDGGKKVYLPKEDDIYNDELILDLKRDCKFNP
ncbi:MAG: hypothetical protein J6D21_09815 [Clostridia bacterium]|nr:hypothetical protein [Clostridia bacterium]